MATSRVMKLQDRELLISKLAFKVFRFRSGGSAVLFDGWWVSEPPFAKVVLCKLEVHQGSCNSVVLVNIQYPQLGL